MEYDRIVMEEEEQEIDVLDMLALILLKWKTILACLLAFAILGCGVAFLKKQEIPAIAERIDSARAVLAADEVNETELLFFKYLSYCTMQREMNNSYTRLGGITPEEGSIVQMYGKYMINSCIDGLQKIYGQLALSDADYQKLREISPDEEIGIHIYDRVMIEDRVNIEAVSSENTNVTIINERGNVSPYLIVVSLAGSSEEQCREMMAVIDAAFMEETETLRMLDPEISISYVGEKFSHNTRDYLEQLRKNYLDKINSNAQELKNLNDQVSKLNSTEKDYYNLLVSQYQQPENGNEASIHVSWKKWTVIGTAAGLLLGVGVIILQYLFDGKVKTAEETEMLLRTSTMQRVFLKGKNNLFGKPAYRLVDADDIKPEVKIELTAADITLLLEKAGHKKVYFLCNEDDSNAFSLANQVAACMKKSGCLADINIGNPSASVEHLERFVKTEEVIAFTEPKKSTRKTLSQWKELCGRYQLPVAGAVTAEVCW